MRTKRTAEQDEALTRLRELLPPGATVYTILRHVSSSGMSRNISPVVWSDGDGRPFDLSWWSLKAGIGSKPRGDREGVRMDGAGMDMGFALVYELGRVLHGDGYAFTHHWL